MNDIKKLCKMYIKITLFNLLAKFTIGATNALIPTYTARQYPTTMRTLAVGFGNLAAGCALITVPYLWLLVCILNNKQKDLCLVFIKLFNYNIT